MELPEGGIKIYKISVYIDGIEILVDICAANSDDEVTRAIDEFFENAKPLGIDESCLEIYESCWILNPTKSQIDQYGHITPSVSIANISSYLGWKK